MAGRPKIRIERDSLGERYVPLNAYYGIQTIRAFENVPISGILPKREFLIATAMVKKAAAIANMATGSLARKTGRAIVKAADEIIGGRVHRGVAVGGCPGG